MRDIVVIENLRKRGATMKDSNLILECEAIERMPRVLDKPPRRIIFRKTKSNDVYGCCAEFVMRYAEIKDSLSVTEPTLDAKGVIRPCDLSVYYVMQTLIKEGCTCISERAEACFDIFRIIFTAPGDRVTEEVMRSVLQDATPINYYASELIKGIMISVFDEKTAVLYWMDLCDNSLGCYADLTDNCKDIIANNCSTEKDVTGFLKPIYREAKQDKEFLSKVDVTVANKWLLPVLYLLYKENPEVFKLIQEGDGFA